MTDYYGLPRTIFISLFIYSIFAAVVSIYRIILYRIVYGYENHLLVHGLSLNKSSLKNRTWYRKNGRLVSNNA